MVIVELILLIHAFFIRKFKLRLKIYQDMIFNFKYLKKLRDQSKKDGDFIDYQKLSKTLDPILLGNLKRFKILRFLFNLLNKILNLA